VRLAREDFPSPGFAEAHAVVDVALNAQWPSNEIRRRVCEKSAWPGLNTDEPANQARDRVRVGVS
jgi:hypothetical protein